MSESLSEKFGWSVSSTLSIEQQTVVHVIGTGGVQEDIDCTRGGGGGGVGEDKIMI